MVNNFFLNGNSSVPKNSCPTDNTFFYRSLRRDDGPYADACTRGKNPQNHDDATGTKRLVRFTDVSTRDGGTTASG